MTGSQKTEQGTVLNIVQTIQALNFASNAVSGRAGVTATLNDAMEHYINGGGLHRFPGFFTIMNGGGTYDGIQYSQLKGADWQPVFGPIVVAADWVAKNTIFAAKSISNRMVVVAIAGTNFDSIPDWLKQDAMVKKTQMVPFPIDPSKPISEQEIGNAPIDFDKIYFTGATAEGVHSLLNMRDDKGRNIKDYLSANASKDDTLVFTGHSLGGALSPGLAMQLYGPGQMDRGDWKDVLVQPSAGASPGTDRFADEFHVSFPPTPTGLTKTEDPEGDFMYWNVNYANTQDVVPHAWNRLRATHGHGSFPSSFAPEPDITPEGVIETIWGYFGGAAKYAFEEAVDAAIRRGEGERLYKNLKLAEFTPKKWQTSDKNENLVDLPLYTATDPAASSDVILPMIEATHIKQYSIHFSVHIPKLPKIV
ncbi:MAG: hypothetical protein NXI16_05850 [Alphaproteobacteria bacterium]|nr:hypothetical protein [Alphaproteobacteria bacterium]